LKYINFNDTVKKPFFIKPEEELKAGKKDEKNDNQD
jgi:hypothetical protein